MPGQEGQDSAYAAIFEHYERRLKGEPDPRPEDLARIAAELDIGPAELEAALARVEAARARQLESEAVAADRAAFEASRWAPFHAAMRRFALVMPLLVAGEALLTSDAVASGVLGLVWAVRLAWSWTRLRWPDPDVLERDFLWWRRRRQARQLVDQGVGKALGWLEALAGRRR
ncbi:MAG: hypothetical protein VKS61_14795 [Candidatus Sericytochromatia bacterium]|nr:hypothetical protein [Candidatus Sericytochromatia bacterium]